MKKTLLLLCALCLAIASQATVVNSSQAKAKAQAFLNEKGLSGTLSEVPNQRARVRDGANVDQSYYYIFNVGADKGYVIVSGDDATPAVLGYATHGSINMDKIPSNMAAWLQGYADQIKYIQEHPVTPQKGRVRVAKATHPAVSDMITTTWDQADPYNLLIEKSGDYHCVTGCATTAMAQIMYYHGYPASSPAISGYTTETNKIKCPDLPATTFEWNTMSTSYGAASSEDSRMAVAKLMQYVATALKADLGTDLTSVWDDKEAPALSTFGYGKGVELKRRDLYTDDNWDNLIYHELSNGRPVLYSGQADDGGHAFVVHGYDGNGYYTVNWGWSGFQDGKYLLSAMTPTSGGIGSTDTSGNGYNTGQTALVGISPNDVETYVVTDDVIALTTEDLAVLDDPATYQPNTEGCYSVNLKMLFTNRLTNTYSFDFDFKVLKDGELHAYLFGEEAAIDGLPPLYGFPWDDTQPKGHESDVTLDLPCGADGIFNAAGTYKIVPVSRESGTTEWLENFGSDTYYLTGIVKADKSLTLYLGEAPDEPGPGPEPEPEVTAEELQALENAIASAETALLDVTTTYQAVDKEVADEETNLKEVLDNISTLQEEVTTITTLLQSDYLTAEQATAYTQQLEEQTAKIDEQQAAADKLSETIQDYQGKLEGLATLITALAAECTQLENDAKTITTKEALDNANAQLDDVTLSITSADETLKTIKTRQLSNDVKALKESTVLTEVGTALTEIKAKIEEDIAAAEEAEKEADEAEKLAKAKEKLDEAITKLDEVITTLSAYNQENTNKLAELKEAVATISENIEALTVRASEIEELLKQLTADNRTRAAADVEAYQKQLEAINTRIGELKGMRDKLQEQISTVEQDIKVMDGAIAEAKALKEQALTASETSTVTDDIKALTQQLTSSYNNLATTGAQNINVIIENLNTIVHNVNSVNDLITNAETVTEELFDVVETAVSTGIASLLNESEIQGRYDLQGRPVDKNHKGVTIIRHKNGKTYKINQ